MERDKTNSILAERIGKLRVGANESQQDLADKIGVKRETVKFWESGDRQIKGGDIAKLAKHFDVSADYLLGLSDVRTLDRDLKFVCEYTRLSEASIKELLEIPQYVGGEAYLGALDRIICEYGYGIGSDLHCIEKRVKEAEVYLSNPYIPSKDHPPIVDFDEAERFIELLEVAIFRFSKGVNSIPDQLFDPESVLSELRDRLDQIIMSTSNNYLEEASENGEHQED